MDTETTDDRAKHPPEAAPPKLALALDASLTTAAVGTLADGLAIVRFHQEAALQGEVEPLHQMRVATRRLRAAVELFVAALHGSRVNAYRRDLRWVGQVAGAVRECDMTAALIKEQSARLDPAMAAALEPIFQRLTTMREAACRALARIVKTRRFAVLGDRLAKPLLRRSNPAATVGEYAPRMIEPIARKARKAGKRIAEGAPPEVLHTLRKRLKRLRYAFEMLAAAGGKHQSRAVERLEEMQDLFGQHHDAVAVAAWLREFASQPDALPATTMMAAGAMIQELGRHQEKLAARSLKRWKQVVREDAITEALREIDREGQRRRRERLKAAAAHRANGTEPAAVVAPATEGAAETGGAVTASDTTGTENAA